MATTTQAKVFSLKQESVKTKTIRKSPFVLNDEVWNAVSSAMATARLACDALEDNTPLATVGERLRVRNEARLKAFRFNVPAGQQAYSKEPKVFTDAFVTKLAADNLKARTKRMPYFVQIANLYKRIGALEEQSQQG